MASFQAAVPLAAFLLAGCPVMVFFLYSIEGVNSAISGSKPYDTPRMPGAPDLFLWPSDSAHGQSSFPAASIDSRRFGKSDADPENC